VHCAVVKCTVTVTVLPERQKGEGVGRVDPSLAAGSSETFISRRSETLEDFFGGDRLGAWRGEPTSNLCNLLVRQPQRVVVLFFHQFNHLRDVHLPVRRLGQYTVKD
jgi:hypothetical protein